MKKKRIVGTSMASFAKMLSSQLDRPVFDRTGITGEYDVTLYGSINEDRLPPRPKTISRPNGPTILTALREQPGLQLENRKRPADVLVMDSPYASPPKTSAARSQTFAQAFSYTYLPNPRVPFHSRATLESDSGPSRPAF